MMGFLSFATSQTGRWVVGGAIVLAIIYAWFLNNNRMLIKLERLRVEREARKTQDKIRTQNHEKLEKTRITRAHPPEPVADVDGLSDDQRRRLIRD